MQMQVMQQTATSNRYAKAIEVSKRIRWDIDRDVIRGRKFDVTKKFLPDGLSKVERLTFLDAGRTGVEGPAVGAAAMAPAVVIAVIGLLIVCGVTPACGSGNDGSIDHSAPGSV